MGRPVPFDGCNRVLTAPDGLEDKVVAMEVFTNGAACVSCWQIDDAELAEIVATRQIFVSVLYGQTQPPIFIGSESKTWQVTLQYGRGWRASVPAPSTRSIAPLSPSERLS